MSAPHPIRLPGAIAVSMAVHATVLAVLLHTRGPVAHGDTPRAELIAVSLVSRPGGGGGGPIPGPPSAPKGPPDLPVVAMPAAPPLPATPPAPAEAPRAAPVAGPSASAVARLRGLSAQPSPVRAAPRASAPAAVAAAPPRSGEAGGAAAHLAGGGGGGAGTGDGAGGDGGDALARPAHGSNPKPPYPLAARRLGVEGVVTLEVVVKPDGTPADVKVRTSSGSPLLDDSARDTVRSRWRFVPARRGDVPIESRVTFPIRFRLDAS